MTIYPHDHRMWAAIGIYAGREDNTSTGGQRPTPPTIVESGGKRPVVGDAAVLGADVIHGVTSRPTVSPPPSTPTPATSSTSTAAPWGPR